MLYARIRWDAGWRGGGGGGGHGLGLRGETKLTFVGVSLLDQTVIVLYGPIAGHADPAIERAQLQAVPYARRLDLERRSPSERRASLAGIALALQCIERLVGVQPPPGQLRFPQDGKPHLPNGPHFSVSHSGDIVACAASTALDLGLDLEVLTHPEQWSDSTVDPRLVGVGVHARGDRREVLDEAIAIAGEHAAGETLGRLRRWTATEATLKAAGRGLRSAGAVTLAPDLRSSELDGRRYFLREVDITRGVVTHLAAATALDEIRLVIDRAVPPLPAL